MTTAYFRGYLIFSDIKKTTMQSRKTRFYNKQILRKAIYTYLQLTFYIKTLINNNLFKSYHVIILWNITALQVEGL